MFFVVSALVLWKCINTALLWYMVTKLLCEPIGYITSVGEIQDSIQIPSKEFLKWTPGQGGEVPPNAIVGGFDKNNEPQFMGRARHGESVIPGKVVCSHGVCYVAWDGKEHAKDEYEVLTTTRLQWVSGANGQVLPNAVVGGITQNGETLFICRAKHKGTTTVGKIYASRTVCYIPYDGQELGKLNYEVLVCQ